MPTSNGAEGAVAPQPVILPDSLLVDLLTRQSEVLDLTEAAAFLKTTEEDILRLIHEQGLPARQTGEGWRFLKAAICRWLGTGTTPPSSRDALLAGAGAFRDDPDLDDIVAQAMRLRGRSGDEAE